jgi:hypothetical protein
VYHSTDKIGFITCAEPLDKSMYLQSQFNKLPVFGIFNPKEQGAISMKEIMVEQIIARRRSTKVHLHSLRNQTATPAFLGSTVKTGNRFMLNTL